MISAQKTRVFYPLRCIRKSGGEAAGSRWAGRKIPFICLTFINFISFHMSNVEITEGELLAHASRRALTNSSRSEAERSAAPPQVERNRISAPPPSAVATHLRRRRGRRRAARGGGRPDTSTASGPSRVACVCKCSTGQVTSDGAGASRGWGGKRLERPQRWAPSAVILSSGRTKEDTKDRLGASPQPGLVEQQKLFFGGGGLHRKVIFARFCTVALHVCAHPHHHTPAGGS